MAKYFQRFEEILEDEKQNHKDAEYNYSIYKLQCEHLEEHGVIIPDSALLPEGFVDGLFSRYDLAKSIADKGDLSHKKRHSLKKHFVDMSREFRDLSNNAINSRTLLHEAWERKFKPEITQN